MTGFLRFPDKILFTSFIPIGMVDGETIFGAIIMGVVVLMALSTLATLYPALTGLFVFLGIICVTAIAFLLT
jgi:hypothetical protein